MTQLKVALIAFLLAISCVVSAEEQQWKPISITRISVPRALAVSAAVTALKKERINLSLYKSVEIVEHRDRFELVFESPGPNRSLRVEGQPEGEPPIYQVVVSKKSWRVQKVSFVR